MKLFDLIKTANSNLWGAKLRTLLTMIAIFIGSSVLTITLGIGEGVKDFVDKQTETVKIPNTLIFQSGNSDTASFGGLGTSAQEYEGKRDQLGITYLTQEDLDKIQDIENVEEVIPFYNISPEYVSYNDAKYNTSVLPYVETMDFELVAGSTESFDTTNSIVIGNAYLDAFGVDNAEDIIGQTITLHFVDQLDEGRDFEFTVVGVMASSIITNTYVIIGDDATQTINEFQSSGVEDLQQLYSGGFAVLDGEYTEEEIDEIKKDFEDEGYGALTFKDQIDGIKSILTTIQAVLALFSLTAIVSSAFGIVNTLLMSVYERVKEIGLMKALGMRNKQVFTLFALEAMIIGFWGSLMGILVGVGFGQLVNTIAANSFLEDLEGFKLFIFPLYQLVLICASIVLVALLSGTLPALKATKLDPIEALRYE